MSSIQILTVHKYIQNSKFYNIEQVTNISVFDPNSEQVRHSDPTCIVPFNKNNTLC